MSQFRVFFAIFMIALAFLASHASTGGNSVTTTPSPSPSPISTHELTTLLLQLSESLQNYKLAQPTVEASLNANVTLALSAAESLKPAAAKDALITATIGRIAATLESLPHTTRNGSRRRKREVVLHEVSCDNVETVIVDKMMVQQTLEQEVLDLQVVIAKLKSFVNALRKFGEGETLAGYLRTIMSLETDNLVDRQAILKLVSEAIAALESFKSQCIEAPSCGRFHDEIEPILTTAVNDTSDIAGEGFSSLAYLQFNAKLSAAERRQAAEGYLFDIRKRIGDVLQALCEEVATLLGISGHKLRQMMESGKAGSGLYECAYGELKDGYAEVAESISQLEQIVQSIVEENS